MGRRAGSRGEDTEINITPMLDIVFIMLIFFIVTTSFVKETGIDPLRPEAASAVTMARGNILIAISSVGQIWMENTPVDSVDVRGRVEAARLQNPESSVIIIADEGAPVGVLKDVMDEIRLGGVTSIAVAARAPD